MRRPILNLAVFVVVLTLAISSLAIIPVASDDTEEILLLLEELRKGVEDEHPSLENKVNAVINQVEAGAYNGAINKLENDVTKSIIKWVEDPEEREELLELVDEIIDLLEELVEQIPDFDISAKPDELEIMQNSSDTSTITVKSFYGFNQPIDLSAELTPATDKVTLALDPTWVIPTPDGNTSTLTVAVDMEAEEGEYVITISGTNGTLVRSVNITLEVEVGPTPPFKDFTIEVSPESLTIQQGGSNTSIITVTSLKGFNRPVDLSITSPPIDDVDATLSPSTVIPPPDEYAFSILTIDIDSTAVIGTYTITVTGTSNDRIHSTDITLQVTSAPTPPVPDFSLAASPTSLTIEQDASDEATIIVASLEGFSETVALKVASEYIEGVELILDPPEVTPPADGFATSTLTIAVAAYAEAEEYVITVSGTYGVVKRSVDITLVVEAVPSPPVKDFTVEASPDSLVVLQGGSNTSVITVTSLDGFSETVDLTIESESILGVDATLNPSQVVPLPNKSAISILTIEVASATTPSFYTITVNGTSGSLKHSVNIVLEITTPLVPPTPDFSIAASPTSLTIQQGDSDKSTIIITSLNGFNKPVDLAITSAKITGVDASLDPLQVTPPSNSFATSILKVDVATDASLGSYTITVTGTSDSLTHSANVSLVVTALPPPPPSAPDFEITAGPSELEIVQGSFATSTIIITSKNGFSQLVDLAVTSDLITGVTTTLNPLQVTPAANSFAISVLRVDVATDAPIGSHIITVTGESDSITKSQNISLEVTAPTPPPPPTPPTPDFTIGASPATLTVEQGESATLTVIVVSLNGFSQPVDLNVTSESIEKVSLILEPSQVTPESNGFATSTLAIEVEIDASPDEHIITVTGTSGALEHSVNVSLTVVVEKTPPVIVSVLRQPETPSYNETVTVLASVIDVGSGVKKVILSYSGGTTWKNETMTLKEGLYRATVPTFPYNTMINYRVYASDNIGNWAAPSSVYSYVVADPYPPVISYVSWSPKKPAANEEINITVTVTEPPYSSGVKEVTLWYRNTTMDLGLTVPMTFKDEKWTATITNQSDTVVTFFIEATDNAGNIAESEEQDITVAAPPGVPLAWILLAIAIIGAGTGGAVYYWRRRRKKSRGTLV